MEFEQAFTAHVEAALEAFGKVGCAVAAVGGGGVYARGFGPRRCDGEDLIDADTLFQVGSTTKAFTATAAAMLADDGRLSLDAPVSRCLPGFRLRDPWLERNLTLRDLLAHRSGLTVDFRPFLGLMEAGTAVAQLAEIDAEAPFRDSFRYNNLLYQVAAQVIEQVSGESWGAFVTRRILRPLGMTRSLASPYQCWPSEFVAPVIFGGAAAGTPPPDRALVANLAMPHAVGDGGRPEVIAWQSYDYAAGAGALVSSASDMLRWARFNLGDGSWEGERLLRPETLRELHRTQNLHFGDNIFAVEGVAETYALGWWRGAYRGATHVAHGGGIIGFPAYVALLPEREAAVVVLCNGPKVCNDTFHVESVLHQAIAFHWFDHVLGLTPEDRIPAFKARLRAAQAATEAEDGRLEAGRLTGAAPVVPPPAFAGDYLSANGATRLQVREGAHGLGLVVDGPGGYAAGLRPWHGTTFRLETRPAVRDCLPHRFLSFRIDPAGRVAAAEMFDQSFARAG